MRNMKISELLLFAMAALHCEITEGINFIMGNCNDTIRLPCTATNRTKTYRYVMWYKTDNLPIVKRKNNEYAYYNLTSVSLGDKETLVLNNVQPSDSGEYKCYLAAEVGGRNDESLIGLNISECLDVSTVYPISTTIPAVSCPAVEELTVPWAVIGLSLISVTKIILCIVTVGKLLHNRKQRREAHKLHMNPPHIYPINKVFARCVIESYLEQQEENRKYGVIDWKVKLERLRLTKS